LGEHHSDVGRLLHNLASMYKSQERYAEAEPLHHQALTIRQDQLGGDHPEVALSLCSLASVYKLQERYVEAEPLYRRALVILEQTQGANHRITRRVRKILALLQQKIKRSIS